MKVIGYIRVSTATQLEGHGLDTQRKNITDYCKNNNLELIDIKADEGISGTSQNRDSLIECLEILQDGAAQKIIVRDVGRLWRDIHSQSFVMKTLEDCGADFISVEEPDLSIEKLKNDPNSYLINTILQALANFQRMEIKLKLAKGRRTKAGKGHKPSGVAPFGYKWEKNHVIIDTGKAEIVKDMYSMYLKGLSLQKIADFLNSKGIMTDRGGNWSKQGVSIVLKNDFYIGIVTHGNIRIDGQHEPVVNRITFGKVKAKLKGNRRISE